MKKNEFYEMIMAMEEKEAKDFLKVVKDNAEGIGEVYNFTNYLTYIGCLKGNSLVFKGLKKDLFIIEGKSFADYCLLVDALQKAKFEGKTGETQLKSIINFLGLDIQNIKKLSSRIIAKKQNANKIDTTSEYYPAYKNLQDSIEALKKNTDIADAEKENELKKMRADLQLMRDTLPLYKNVSNFQVTSVTFRKNTELEIAGYLAEINLDDEYTTLKDKELSKKHWQNYLKKAKFYGINTDAYTSILDFKGLKDAVKKAYKLLEVEKSKTLGIDIADYTDVHEYIIDQFEEDAEFFKAFYGKEKDGVLAMF